MMTTSGGQRIRKFIAAVGCVVLGACGAATPPSRTAKSNPIDTGPTDTERPSEAAEAWSADELLRLPADQQAQALRAAATQQRNPELRAHALAELAHLNDPKAAELATKALGSENPTVRVQAARVLAFLGPAAARAAASALFEALGETPASDRCDLVWALVVAGGERAAAPAIELSRSGRLQEVQRLDGGLAFDAPLLGPLLRDQAAKLLKRTDDPTARWLAALALASRSDASAVEPLLGLARDSDRLVSRAALLGLARRDGKREHEAVVAFLKRVDQKEREALLTEVRHQLGGAALVGLLDAATGDVERDWLYTKLIFALLTEPEYGGYPGLEDPGAGDALLRYIGTKPHVHWQTSAALALARVGDLRAAPLLAQRLRMDPLQVYSDQYEWEMVLKRDDGERVRAARLLGDLAVLHPEQRATLRKQAEAAVTYWLGEMPSPHANGMRALAAMRTKAHADLLRGWADPQVPLPQPGQQPPMPEEWVIAQSAMRYAGVLRDPHSWAVFEKALQARPKGVDVTMDSLMQGGLAILGMSLRAIGVGAAQGFSEWGDARAFPLLLDYIQDPRENEQSRMEACAALAWVATDAQVEVLLDTLAAYHATNRADAFRQACIMQALTARRTPAAVPLLTEIVMGETRETPPAVVLDAGRALGRAGVPPALEQRLLDKVRANLESPGTFPAAALAVILGGSRSAAIRAARLVAFARREAGEELQEAFYRSLGLFTQEDLDSGTLFRWVRNASAISRFTVGESARMAWAEELLGRELRNLMFDNGPHSLTRVVFQTRLLQIARGSDAAKRRWAIETLRLAGAEGALVALSREAGELGWLAHRAHHQFLNPRLVRPGSVVDSERW